MNRLRPPTWITTAAGWVGSKVLSPVRRLIDAWDAADTELASAGADLGYRDSSQRLSSSSRATAADLSSGVATSESRSARAASLSASSSSTAEEGTP